MQTLESQQSALLAAVDGPRRDLFAVATEFQSLTVICSKIRYREDLPKKNPTPADHLNARVKDFMEVPPMVVHEDITIDNAAGMMWDRNIGSVIIVDEDGRMAGIVTERDVLFAVTKSLVGREVPVSSIMSKTSLKASANESIVTAVDRMIKGGVRHLPVIDKDGTPLGMVSMRDAMGISEPLLRFVFRSARKKKPSEVARKTTKAARSSSSSSSSSSPSAISSTSS
jgi:CBS domain-containing protein